MNTDQILAQIAREELGIEETLRSGEAVLVVSEVRRALQRAFEAGQEAMVYDQNGTSDVVFWNGGWLRTGERFASLGDETDSDHEDQERVTPAGSVWWVDAIYPDAEEPYVRLVCDATGAIINPSLDQLTHEFERQTEARSE